MKKLFTATAMCFTLFFCTATVSAQSINININIQPSWGPVGYDYAEYYYIPELNIYYDVTNALFYFLSSGTWTGAKYLPLKYKRFDLSSLYKVVLNGEPAPWNNNKVHKKTYKTFINDRTQVAIRHSTEQKYETSRKNTQPWVDNKPATTPAKKTTASSKSKNTASPAKNASKSSFTSKSKTSATKASSTRKTGNTKKESTATGGKR